MYLASVPGNFITESVSTQAYIFRMDYVAPRPCYFDRVLSSSLMFSAISSNLFYYIVLVCIHFVVFYLR